MNKHEVGDIVTYIGSDDEWNHECCKGAEYKVTKVYPPVWGIYYYNLEAITKGEDVVDHLLKYEHYTELNSVREYQLEKTNNDGSNNKE
jgi:hypothetical protein